MLDPAGRVALVSGATRGIGRAACERLLSLGYRVSAGVRAPGRIAAAEGLFATKYDAEQDDSAEAWVAATMERFGRIDAVVNCAGINPMGQALVAADEPAIDEMWRVNVKGPMRVTRAAWPHLIASGEGRVVNVASLSGKRLRTLNAGYGMSKFALIALTQAFRKQGYDHGIRVSALCPGFVMTDMTMQAPFPREQMSRPEDLAVLVETLLRLPNTAHVAEILVNCKYEDLV